MTHLSPAPVAPVDVQAEVAALGYNAVGTYLFGYSTSGDTSAGSTRSGSTMRATSAAYQTRYSENVVFTNSSGLSGTWRCMGRYDHEIWANVSGTSRLNMSGATLWKRIS